MAILATIGNRRAQQIEDEAVARHAGWGWNDTSERLINGDIATPRW
jgi:hypothetical protein